MNRKKTDLLFAIQQDHSGEHWMTMVLKFPEHPDGDSRWESYKARQIDISFQDAIADAIIDYWLVIPPIQARSWTMPGMFGERYAEHVIARRVRVMRATMDELSRPENPILRAIWLADPLPTSYDYSATGPWSRYVPEYDPEPLPKERQVTA